MLKLSLVALSLAIAVSAGPLAQRDDENGSCQNMFGSCIAPMAANNYSDPFSNIQCVLAATCWRTVHPSNPTVDDFLKAQYAEKHSNGTAPTSLKAPRLSKAIFTSISQDGGKTITQQNYIDAYYGLITIQHGIYPYSSAFLIDDWSKIAAWTGFCSGARAIPYQNLADWFEYSSTITVPATCDDITSTIDSVITATATPSVSIISSFIGVSTSAVTSSRAAITTVTGSVVSSFIGASTRVVSSPRVVTTTTPASSFIGASTRVVSSSRAAITTTHGSAVSSFISATPVVSSTIRGTTLIVSSAAVSSVRASTVSSLIAITPVTTQATTTISSAATPVSTQRPAGDNGSCEALFGRCFVAVKDAGAVNSFLKAPFAFSDECTAAAICYNGSIDGYLTAITKILKAGATAPKSKSSPRLTTSAYNFIGKSSGNDKGVATKISFINFYYGALGSTGPWPTNTYVISLWNKVAAWTGECSGEQAVPYMNLADYFQYSSTINGPALSC